MTVSTDSPAFWADRWQTGQTGWDLGGPHPGLSRLIAIAVSDGLLSAGAAILEPGCGRAHGAADLARQGFQVTAFDVVPEAVVAARALYGEVPGLTLVEQDALRPVPEWLGRFDAVYDRAVLCALPRHRRRAYAQTCFQHLKPGGLLLTIPFTELTIPESDGPPFAVTMHDLSDLLLAGFSLVHAEPRPVTGASSRIVAEALCIWQRRAKLLVESE